MSDRLRPILSDAPSPPRRPTGSPPWLKAAGYAAFLLAVGLVMAPVWWDMWSADFSAASGVAPTTSKTPTPAPTASSTAGTSTSAPSRDTTPLVVVIATEPAPPFKAPKPRPTPFPTCPVDRPGVTCFKAAPTPTPRPIPTLAPTLFCDVAPPETWCVTRLTPTPSGAATPQPADTSR